MSVRRSTIIDVAQLAGVSRQTVSRVLNASPNVSKKTEKKVLSVMKKLKYRPDSLARSMVTRRTYLLGALTRDLRYTHSQILEGAEIWARKAGFQIVISGCEHNEHGEPVHSPLLYGQRFDGLLIVYQGSRLDTYEILDEVLEDIPIVSIGYAANKPRVTSISIENRKAACQATQHLISLGHRRIGHITGPSYYFDCEQHRLGYLDALKKAGLPPDKSLIAEGSWTEESGYAA
ncbi:MAG TPA: LacI family DNA-binding transcriptional regulator, partial [Spirochaetia bacterium]|nr:LacI family DNA-binding transcriptional regulator [Spirochaetia bacterium]